jgi:hypothetical protein
MQVYEYKFMHACAVFSCMPLAKLMVLSDQCRPTPTGHVPRAPSSLAHCLPWEVAADRRRDQPPIPWPHGTDELGNAKFVAPNFLTHKVSLNHREHFGSLCAIQLARADAIVLVDV